MDAVQFAMYFLVFVTGVILGRLLTAIQYLFMFKKKPPTPI